jgi:hypothetical protein
MSLYVEILMHDKRFFVGLIFLLFFLYMFVKDRAGKK